MTGKTKKGRERRAHAIAGTPRATMNRAKIERALARLSKERDDLRRNTMTIGEVVGYLEVSTFTVTKWVRQGKIDRRSRGRYDRKSVEAFAKALAKERTDFRPDEVAGYLDVSIQVVAKLAREGKIDRRSHGRYTRKSVEVFAKALGKERAVLRLDTMTLDEVAGFLDVSIPVVTKLAREGKIDRRSRGRYDRKSVEAFTKVLAKKRADLRRDTMILDEVAVYLDVPIHMVQKWASQEKIDRRSHGRYDRKSVEAFAKALAKECADLRRDTMTLDEVAAYLDVPIHMVQIWARQGKIDRRSYGRYDTKSVEAFADTGT